MSVIHVFAFRHTTHEKWFFSFACCPEPSWRSFVRKNLPPITAGEIRIKIFCELNHNSETNPRQLNVIHLTKTGVFCRFSPHCVFFRLWFCDSDHLFSRHTPCIYVIVITQFFAVWTVERFSARFHSIRTGPGYLCRRTLTINLGPQA